MDYSEQMFAFQVQSKVDQLISDELRHTEMTQEELAERIGEHIRDIIRLNDATVKAIRAIRNGS